MATRGSVPITIPATRAHRQFGEIIRRVYSGKEHFIVEKDGLPVVAVISMAEYEAIIQAQASEDTEKQSASLKQFQQAARTIGEEIERMELTEDDVEARVESVRQEIHEGKNE